MRRTLCLLVVPHMVRLTVVVVVERDGSLNVHAALSAIFPQCAKRMDDSGEVSDEPFSPHLTVGQCTREEAAEISRNWTGGSMIVSAIHVLSRSDINATFKIRHTFYLREREPRE